MLLLRLLPVALSLLHAPHRPLPPSLRRLPPPLALADDPPQLLRGEAAMLRAFESAGLSAEQSQELWSRRPPGKLPGPARQLELLRWLQTELQTTDPLAAAYLCVYRAPRLMLRASALPELRESLAATCALCGSPSAAHLGRLVCRHPTLLLLPADAQRQTARWLRDATGLSDAHLADALAQAPHLLLSSRAAVRSRLAWLRDELGVEGAGRVSRVVREAPLVLGLSVERTMSPRVAWLCALGLTSEEVGTVVVRSPRVLHTPLSELERKLDWLRKSGVASGPQLASLLRVQPDFFSLSSARCNVVFEWLQQQGVSAAEAAEMLRREPTIFSQKTSELELRVQFFTAVLGGSPSDLAHSPQILTCDLSRVAMLRHAFCMSKGLQVKLDDLLSKSSAHFAEVAGCDEAELRQFENDGKHLSFYQGSAL